MDINELKQYLQDLSKKLSKNDFLWLNSRRESLVSVFPFHEYEYMLMFFLEKNVITFQEYENLREKYISTNPYLKLYELPPRIFGEKWGHQHLRTIERGFQKPDRTLDPDYQGEYDLWFEGVKIEVKACRAINKRKKGNLMEKALRYGGNEPFWMNYQQIKPQMADVFVFIGVWVDEIIYWVMSQEEIQNPPALSHQHRGGQEYQIGISRRNLAEFDRYQTRASDLGETILRKGKKHEKT